jgi:hypothetical protein
MRGMSKLALIIAVLPVQASATDSWQECQIESVSFCDAEGCRLADPKLKLYFGDYADPAGKRKGYYYRCRRDGPCDMIEDPWIGQNERYRAFIMREQGIISRIGADGKVTDVSTVDDTVLISRGSCWDAEPQPIRRKR